jgi:hypothetical protein
VVTVMTAVTVERLLKRILGTDGNVCCEKVTRWKLFADLLLNIC